MAVKRVLFHPEAELEFLTSLARYQGLTAAADFELAPEFERAVTSAVEVVARTGQLWPSYYERFRKCRLRQFPFSIVYEELPSEIVVFAVAHACRRPSYWKNRT